MGRGGAALNRIAAMPWCLAMLLVAAAQVAGATQYKVGGDAGWTLPSFGGVNYTDWTSDNTYHIGDVLVFNYSSQFHSVLVVNKADYQSCSTVNPIASFQDGHTVITLDRTGPHYYICGVDGHCGQGQKLLITVRGRGRHHSAQSPSPSSSPSQASNISAPSTSAGSFAPGPHSAGTQASAPLALAIAASIAALVAAAL